MLFFNFNPGITSCQPGTKIHSDEKLERAIKKKCLRVLFELPYTGKVAMSGTEIVIGGLMLN